MKKKGKMPPVNNSAKAPTDHPSASQPARRWPLHLHHKGIWLVIAVVVIGLGLISYFGLKHKNKSNPAATQTSVNITSKGFIPQEISIKAGSQLIWTNHDKAAHEVAADPYPKNNSIPGFNSNVLLQTNDSYSFTFEQKGTYHYHDQLRPFKLLGTVVVR